LHTFNRTNIALFSDFNKNQALFYPLLVFERYPQSGSYREKAATDGGKTHLCRRFYEDYICRYKTNSISLKR
jgi:hypothetical protein